MNLVSSFVSNLSSAEFQDKFFTSDSIKYTKEQSQDNSIKIIQNTDNAETQKGQVGFWKERVVSMSKIKLVSGCVAIYSAIVTPASLLTGHKIGAVFVFLIGLFGGVVAALARKRENEAQEQVEEWSVDVNLRATADEFKKHVETLNLPVDRTIECLFGMKKKSSPLQIFEGVSKMIQLLNLFKARFRKESV